MHSFFFSSVFGSAGFRGDAGVCLYLRGVPTAECRQDCTRRSKSRPRQIDRSDGPRRRPAAQPLHLRRCPRPTCSLVSVMNVLSGENVSKEDKKC
jgi:hypothetical protein